LSSGKNAQKLKKAGPNNRVLSESRFYVQLSAKSAHGPWRLSRSPDLAFALPARYFASLGVPRLSIKTT
jgi:hypothetical protein